MKTILAIAILWLVFLLGVGAQTPQIPKWILEEQFLRACQDADLETVKRLLSAGISPNVRDRFGQSALLRAARAGLWSKYDLQADVVRTLVEAGADVNATNEFGSTAIFLTESGNQFDADAHKYLLSRQPRDAVLDRYGLVFEQRPAYESYVKIDESEIAWRMLLEGDLGKWPSKPTRHKNSATLTMAAAYYGDTPLGFEPIKDAVEVDDRGESYLFYMASRKHFSVEELSDLDPKVVNIISKTGETALIRAAKFDNDFMVHRLLLNRADPTHRDSDGYNALDHSAENNYPVTTLSLLLKADPRAKDRNGITALMRAARNGSVKAIRAFVLARLSANEAFADAKRDIKEGRESAKTADQLRRIDPDQRDQKGMTALMMAVENGHAQVVEELLTLKADKNLKDKAGRTALSIARVKGRSDIIQLLMKK